METYQTKESGGRDMKKMLAMLLTGAMVLSLAACGNSSSGNAPAQSSSGAEESKETGGGSVTLNVTTTFAGEDTNAANIRKRLQLGRKRQGTKSTMHPGHLRKRLRQG